jgi:hypothetical protein
MGEVIVEGKDAGAFLRKLIPTSMQKLEAGKSMYSMFCNEKGGVIDDLFIYMFSDNKYYLVAKIIGSETSRVLGVSVKGKTSGKISPLVKSLSDKIVEIIQAKSEELIAK